MTTQEPDKFREIKMKTVHLTSKEKNKYAEFISVLIPYPTNQIPLIHVTGIDSKDVYGVSVRLNGVESTFLISKDGQISFDNRVIDVQG
jgi:hypothetical protein